MSIFYSEQLIFKINRNSIIARLICMQKLYNLIILADF